MMGLVGLADGAFRICRGDHVRPASPQGWFQKKYEDHVAHCAAGSLGNHYMSATMRAEREKKCIQSDQPA
jgi:hypothetical protein